MKKFLTLLMMLSLALMLFAFPTGLAAEVKTFEQKASSIEFTKLDAEHIEQCMICGLGGFLSEYTVYFNEYYGGSHYYSSETYYKCTYNNHLLSYVTRLCCANPNHRY